MKSLALIFTFLISASAFADFQIVYADGLHVPGVYLVIENPKGPIDKVRVRSVYALYRHNSAGMPLYRQTRTANGTAIRMVKVGTMFRGGRNKAERVIEIEFSPGLEMPLARIAYFPQRQQMQILDGSEGFDQFIGTSTNLFNAYVHPLKTLDRESLTQMQEDGMFVNAEAMDGLLITHDSMHLIMGDMTPYLRQEVLEDHNIDLLNGPESEPGKTASIRELNHILSCNRALSLNIQETSARGKRIR